MHVCAYGKLKDNLHQSNLFFKVGPLTGLTLGNLGWLADGLRDHLSLLFRA